MTEQQASGRMAHGRKVTVYLTDAELVALEGTVLELQRRYGVRVDRGRFVREAILTCRLGVIASRVKRSL